MNYDSIIVGGGHNGLVAAAYLARGGRKVLVLERRELVGGCAVTEEIWPGYRVSTAAYLTSLLQERIVRELELARFGYQVDAKDPAFFSAFPDGRHFFMWQERARTLAFIRRAKNPADFLITACNFTPVPRAMHRLGVPELCWYEELINSDSTFYGGSNMGNGGCVSSRPVARHNRPHSISVTLPPLAVVAFKKL